MPFIGIQSLLFKVQNFLKYFSICAATHTFCAPIQVKTQILKLTYHIDRELMTDNQNSPYPRTAPVRL